MSFAWVFLGGREKTYKDETANDNDKTITITSNTVFKLECIHLEVTTTATVGNRRIGVIIQDSDGNNILAFTASDVQEESKDFNYEFYPGADRIGAEINSPLSGFEGMLTYPIPALILHGGATIRVFDVNAVDVNDTIKIYIKGLEVNQ